MDGTLGQRIMYDKRSSVPRDVHAGPGRGCRRLAGWECGRPGQQRRRLHIKRVAPWRMAGGVAGTPTGRILTAMTYRRLTLILLGMAAALLVACGGDGGGSSSSHTVSPRTPESKVSTGIGDLDQPLNTALSGDEIEMARLTGYQRANCSPFPSGDSPPPLCRSEEADKTSVEVFGTVG